MNQTHRFNQRLRYRFRRFARKSYSAFMSLHREVSIGRVRAHVCNLEMLKSGRAVALCSLCVASMSLTAADEQSAVPLLDSEQLTLEEVMVVAEKAELQSQNLRVINLLSSEQIGALPVNSVSDLLDYLPGIDARSRGANGAQTDISIRGGSFDQVIVLLNGQNMTDPQTGHYTMDLPIDLSMIDHVEVLTGTGMSQFGLSAFSGAINIVTKENFGDDSKPHFKVGLEGGAYGLFHPSLSGAYDNGRMSLTASAQYNSSTGYADNTDYRIGDLFVRSAIHHRSGDWQVQAGAQYKGVGANSFYSLAYPDQFDATKTGLLGLNYRKHLGAFTIQGQLSYRAHHDRFELFRETWKRVEPAAWYTSHNYHLTQTAAANLSVRYASRVGTTTAGIELRDENIMSNVLGDERKDAGTSRFTHSKNRLNINYFAQQTFYWQGLSAGVGLSGNWNSMFLNNMAWSVNLGYELPKGVMIYANANQGVRLPTFTDLYYKSATQLSNPELKPEKAITAELGLRWRDEHWSVQGSGYYRWGRNIIDWVLMPGEDRWQSKNLTEVNAAGCEAQAAYRLNEWLREVSLSYTFCHLDKRADGFISKYALDYMRHKLVFNIRHGIWRGLGAQWTLSWQQREGDYTNRQGEVESYRPVVLFDGSLFYEWRRWRFSVDATNLIGTQYYDYGGILQPGRWIKAKVNVSL